MDGVILSVSPALRVGIIGLRDRSQVLFEFCQLVDEVTKADPLLVGDEIECELGSSGLIVRFWMRRKSTPRSMQ